jgi:hypothetical protein
MSERNKGMSCQDLCKIDQASMTAWHIRRSGVHIYPSGYAGPVRATSAVLADYVEVMEDWDIVSAARAQMLTVELIPSTVLLLLIQYRTTFSLTRQFGSRGFSQSDHRHFATKFQTGVVMMRPQGPLGAIAVILKPEAASSLLEEHMQCFLDAEVSLDAIFGASQLSLLEERLAEATTSAERFACVERFFAVNLRPHRVKPVACQAAALLRQNPRLRVQRFTFVIALDPGLASCRAARKWKVEPTCSTLAIRISSQCAAHGTTALWTSVRLAS